MNASCADFDRSVMNQVRNGDPLLIGNISGAMNGNRENIIWVMRLLCEHAWCVMHDFNVPLGKEIADLDIVIGRIIEAICGDKDNARRLGVKYIRACLPMSCKWAIVRAPHIDVDTVSAYDNPNLLQAKIEFQDASQMIACIEAQYDFGSSDSQTAALERALSKYMVAHDRIMMIVYMM